MHLLKKKQSIMRERWLLMSFLLAVPNRFEPLLKLLNAIKDCESNLKIKKSSTQLIKSSQTRT